MTNKSTTHKIIFGVIFTISIVFSFYNVYYSNKILPKVFIASVDVSGVTKEEAARKLGERFSLFYETGIKILINGNEEVIDPKNIDLALPADSLTQVAWALGRDGTWLDQLMARISAPFSMRVVSSNVEVNSEKLASEIDILLSLYDNPRKDIRYKINGISVDFFYDTERGAVFDRKEAERAILSHIANLDVSPVELFAEADLPKVNSDFLNESQDLAEQLISSPLALAYKDKRFNISREKIASWISSRYEKDTLLPEINHKLVSEYVIGLADEIDTKPQNPIIIVGDGKVVEFTAPQKGRALSQDETVKLITDALYTRNSGSGREIVRELSLPVLIKKPQSEGSAADLGIVELIGKATTPFTGSPKNRILNIKNGAKFLTGVLIPPGEEFSTVEALGRIDNTSGYLPELVIKGDETVPEFGGGLCQVSTTLFRSVLNAGLPVIERRNHSYRVPYYERDGEGNFIGPGLDATIYSENPDFKFKNDTSSHILIQGFVEGDKITFELYGTGDGRKSFIDGPHTIEETSPGEPIYIETVDLPRGETKKIDTAHSGGVAVATYKIEYPDGRVEEQEFKSYYRRWSDKYLVGTYEPEGAATSTSPLAPPSHLAP